MSMKKILMAAVAVSALSAGAASAATISNTSTVGGVSLAPTVPAALYEPYTVASELVASATDTASVVMDVVPDTSVPAGTYVVTYTVSGGKFKASSVVPTGTAATSSTPTISSISDTQVVVSYVNVGALTKFRLAADVLVGTSKSPITFSAAIATAGGTPVDGGSTGAVTILDYRSGFAVTATATPQSLALVDSFKKFGTSGTSASNSTSADIGTNVGIIANNGYDALGTTLTNDRVWADFAGTALNPSSLISGVTIKLSGDLTAWKFRAVATDTVYGDAGAPDTITASGNVLAGLRQTYSAGTYTAPAAALGLAQLTVPVAGNESAYTVTPTVTMTTPALYTTPTFSAKALGSVTYQGTAFYAPWFGDGTNGITYTVRLSNAGSTAIPFAQIKLNSPYAAGTSGTVAGTATCSVGSIPAKGELLITSAMANACFGSFKRGDLTIITGKSGTAATTAKMRSTAVNGTVSEVTLGTGAAAAALQPYN